MTLDIHQAKRQAEAERSRKERARREATIEDRAGRRALSKQEQMRVSGSEEGIGLETDGHRIIAEENLDVGAGKNKGKRPRVLTQADLMHRLGKITQARWEAAEALRKKVMALLPPSEGVSSYGLSPGRADPATKADRKARRLTGYEVNWRKGEAKLDADNNARRNRSELREAAEMLYAMAGVETEDGRKAYDLQLAVFLVRSVLEASPVVMLTEIGEALTAYTGEKQASAAGGAILNMLYHRGAVYLGLEKADDWDDKLRWLPT